VLVLDIETKLDPWALSLYNLHAKPIVAPANYRDPDKITAYIKKKTDERTEKAALSPWTGRIVSSGLGMAVRGELDSVTAAVNLGDEVPLLTHFWDMVNGPLAYPLVGYNILGFDLPFIMARSLMHGITPTRKISLARYRTGEVVDLMQWLFSWGGQRYLSLKTVCEYLAIPNPLPGVSGELVDEMSEEEIKEYQVNDVRLTWNLYKKMLGVFI
jgi:hypothetical protein